MSVQTPSQAPRAEPSVGAAPFESIGRGWLTFAGVLLAIGGAMNCIGGIAAIGDSRFFASGARFVVGDLTTWGWALLVTGAAQILTAFGIWARKQPARWAGVAFAGLNSMAQVFVIDGSPFWSLAVFGLDLLVIFGLIVYGSRYAIGE